MSKFVFRAAAVAVMALPLMAAAQGASASLPLLVGQGAGGNSYSVPIQTLLFFTALSFLPAILLLMTGFTRIVIVLSLLRQALGTLPAQPQRDAATHCNHQGPDQNCHAASQNDPARRICGPERLNTREDAATAW